MALLELIACAVFVPVAQWIERLRPKEGVGSSNLSGDANLGNNFIIDYFTKLV